MSRIPYSPATDATPRDTDLDPHAHCRAREAAVTRALAEADAMAAAVKAHQRRFGHQWSDEARQPENVRLYESLAAYLAAREETL